MFLKTEKEVSVLALFKKKDEDLLPGLTPPSAPQPSDIPVDLVISMRKQGMDNNAIIQSLQAKGYSSSQIFAALTQADEHGVGQKTKLQSAVHDFNAMPDPAPSVAQQQAMPPPIPSMPGSQQSQPVLQGDQTVTTEEIVEAIIDEKWNELMKDIGKIVEWKNSVEARIMNLENNLKSLQHNFDKLHSAVIARVTEYDKHLLNIHGQLKAFETVLSKFLPVFSENVQELSAAVNALKGVTRKKSSKKKK